VSGPWEDFAPQVQAQSDGPWADFAKPAVKRDPKIGQPEELSFAEKYLAPVLDKLGVGDVAGGNVRGSAVGRLAMGAADPGAALVQLGANAIGQGDGVNKAIQSTEQQYQDARKAAGSEGFDPLRLVGNVGMTAFMGGAAPAVGALDKAAPVVKAGIQGAGFGAAQPVVDGGDAYWTEKAKQTALGTGAGAGTSLLGGLLSRVVSPKASVNPDVQLLRNEGVQPTIGQTLGGVANNLEEKAMSLPFVGDAIRNARARAVEQFNNAAIGRAVSPIGASVEGAGQGAVAKAGDALSNAYEAALAKVNHVNFDTPAFNQKLGELQNMASGLSPDLAAKFDKTLSSVVLRKMSPNGSILGADIKAVDSELGGLAARYGRSSVASEQEFGDAVKQLQAIVRQEVGRSNPEYAAAQAAADKGWANLVRVEGAAKNAVNNEGVFSPAQLNSAIRGADQSVRDRATARGTALMQDLGTAGQNVLANRVPNSGTTDRALLVASGAGAMAAPMMTIPAALAGAAAYSQPVQNALRALIASRPAGAPLAANELRRIMALAPYAAVPAVESRR
jgi:hypothetical protein